MTTKHTPGPWAIVDVPPYGPEEPLRHAIVCKADPIGTKANDIAAVWLRGGEEKTLANARLIAAAPELLDALEDLLECPYHIDEATVSKAGLEATMNANQYQVVGNMSVALFRVRKARAAIAKATGEQQ